MQKSGWASTGEPYLTVLFRLLRRSRRRRFFGICAFPADFDPQNIPGVQGNEAVEIEIDVHMSVAVGEPAVALHRFAVQP